MRFTALLQHVELIVSGGGRRFGYRHNELIDNLAADGVGVLIPPDSSKRKSTRPG